MDCPKCGRAVPEGMQFCAGCGNRLDTADAAKCPKCGAPHPPDAKFCKQCGQSFAASARVEPATVTRSEPSSAPKATEPPPPAKPESATPSTTDARSEPVPAPKAPEPPPLARPPTAGAARAKSGPPGWLLGVLVAVIVVVVGGAAAIVYFKFLHPTPNPAVVVETPAVSAPVAAGTSAAGLGPIVSAMAEAGTPVATSAPTASTNVAQSGVQGPTQPLASEPQAAVPPVATPESKPVAEPPVDHTLKIASDLVRKGERAYAQGDYETAVRHARSALDVRAGYAPAERLQQRAYAAQKRVSEQQTREQQRVADEQQRAQAAQAAAAPPKPTPDQIYNKRAHSECARGMFGKSCRHKIRIEVCQGVAPESPGSTVCKDTD